MGSESNELANENDSNNSSVVANLLDVCKKSEDRNYFSSIHRFIWPFYMKKRFKPEDYGWKTKELDKMNAEWYATYQYLSNNANKIFDSNNNICKIYTKSAKDAYYLIEKTTETGLHAYFSEIINQVGFFSTGNPIHLYKEKNGEINEEKIEGIKNWHFKCEKGEKYYVFDDNCKAWLINSNSCDYSIFNKDDKKTSNELLKDIYKTYVKNDIKGPIIINNDLHIIDVSSDKDCGSIDINEKSNECRQLVDQYLNNKDTYIYMNPLINSFIFLGIKDKFEYHHKIKLYYNFCLPVSDYEMHVYNNKIGMLFLNTINLKFNNHNEIDRMKMINDYGRRIEIPFFPKNGTGITADKIGIIQLKSTSKDNAANINYGSESNSEKSSNNISNDNNPWISDYDKYINEYNKNNGDYLANSYKPSSFLTEIIFYDNNKKTKPAKSLAEEYLNLDKNTEERMFAMTLVNIPSLCEEVKKIGTENQDNAIKTLYPVIFNDYGDASCQNTELRNSLFCEASNLRWTDYGTLHAITQYSFTCITSIEHAFDEVALPFINNYSYLCSIVLAQRYMLLDFADKYTNVIIQGNTTGSLIKDYAIFKNELLLTEVSTQEQGIEIYRKMRKQMLVDSELEELESQMSYLNESVAYKFNKKINFLSYYGVVLAIIIYFEDTITVKLDSLFKGTLICKFADSVKECLSFKTNFNFYLGIIILIYLVLRIIYKVACIIYKLFKGKLNYYYKRVCEYTRDNKKQIAALILVLIIAFILLYLVKSFWNF